MGFFDFLKSSPKTTPPPPAAPAPPAAESSTRTTVPLSAGRVLLIHGYSANWTGFVPWSDALKAAGIDMVPISIGNYITLNNEVTIKDIGEGFDRALRFTPWSTGNPTEDTFTFDAIVHSTGMLVLRQWLTSDPFLGKLDTNGNPDPRSRIARVKHLVGLAPATFGSPQGKQGRSWIGALVKGSKDPGPDFLNAGDQVLLGLELASSYTWDLAHKDMICPKPLYDTGSSTPYVTVFIGNSGYTGLSAVANSPGSDGTVRWAGCALNTRKVSVDLRRQPQLTDASGNSTRCFITPWEEGRLAAPMIAVNGKNHGTLIADPDPAVQNLIVDFLQVSSADQYNAWEARALDFGKPSLDIMNTASVDGDSGGAGWQQIVVHMVDDHGDPVPDYNLQLFIGDSLDQSDPVQSPNGDLVANPKLTTVPLIVDTYSADSSFRCFYIRLSDEMLTLNTPGAPPKKMWLELIASSNSTIIDYEAYPGDATVPPQSMTVNHDGGSAVKIDITALTQGDQSLLYPYTTTLLEIFVEREPLPLGTVSQIFTFK